MGALCASCPWTFPSPRGVWAGTHVTSPSELILTIGGQGSCQQSPSTTNDGLKGRKKGDLNSKHLKRLPCSPPSGLIALPRANTERSKSNEKNPPETHASTQQKPS